MIRPGKPIFLNTTSPYWKREKEDSMETMQKRRAYAPALKGKNTTPTKEEGAIQPFLTSEQACQFMQIGLRTLYKLMAIGLPYYKIGGCTRFQVGDLMDWLQGCNQEND